MEIRQRQIGTVVCLDVDGRLVWNAEDGLLKDVLKDKVNSLLLQGYRHILLNFEHVSRVDTSGLAALTAVRAAVEIHGGIIKLVNLPPRIYDLLVITKLLTVFDVFESEADAVASFGQHADA